MLCYLQQERADAYSSMGPRLAQIYTGDRDYQNTPKLQCMLPPWFLLGILRYWLMKYLVPLTLILTSIKCLGPIKPMFIKQWAKVLISSVFKHDSSVSEHCLCSVTYLNELIHHNLKNICHTKVTNNIS